ncbi:MAG TPA: c-type cytochrome [Vicinamibacterales bacterium]|nr:c-type cytochrome [Vicinamibacterales bacterium]
MHRTRVFLVALTAGILTVATGITGQQGTATVPGNIWPPPWKQMAKSIPLSPEDEMKTFSMPPGFRVELVAAEPMVDSPILIDFDADGRLWVVEMLTFLPDSSGRDSTEPLNRVSVLEDTDNDGRMDRKTIFADRLRQARALKVLDRGVLVGEPPNLWFMKDTDGDLKADVKDLVVNTFGNPNGNIEHNANSLFWAIDNVMYSSEHVWDVRWRKGRFEPLPALSRGQWLISQDDAGRIYRNVNDSPLFVDYTPSRYYLRNPNLVRTRGLYELLIEQADATIYPVRDTRGVNRGYRDPFFRPDGSSIVIQGASGPVIYRGDVYPRELRGNAFIPDSPTNLVHRMVINDAGGGRLEATNGYARGEFLASSDERFRPVALADGPDGCLYVVDMYRGVVQAGGLWSEYLTDYIRTNDMLMPVGKGRIWRVVYGNRAAPRPARPALSKAAPAQLVEALANPNGWWRDTAQRLLVERGETSAAPALTALAASAPDWRTRLHALWTLDGLDAIEPASVRKAMADANGDVRAAAVRLSERWLERDPAMRAAALALADDRHWNVRRQLAASIGEMPAADRVDPAVAILTRYGSDPIVVDAAVSSLKGIEGDVLTRVMQSKPAPAPAPGEAVSMLAAAVTKSGDVPAVQRLIDAAADAARPEWARIALLRGVDAALPSRAAGGRGGRGLPGLSAPGGRIVVTPGRGIALPAEPAALTKLAGASGTIGSLAASVSAKLDWPGRPAPMVAAAPLNAEQQKRFTAGAEIYKNVCLGCHQEDGRGKDKLGANLVESAYVNAADPAATIRIMVGGKEGSIGLMPPLGPAMTDEDIAAALTYVRRAWGHTAPPVDPLNVMEIRALSKGRTRPWTDQELEAAGRGRGRGGH